MQGYCEHLFADVQQGVQKISKIVINGSILVVRHAVERLGKNKQFQREKKFQKSVLWSPTQPLKMTKKAITIFFIDKVQKKTPETKKMRKG